MRGHLPKPEKIPEKRGFGWLVINIACALIYVYKYSFLYLILIRMS